MYALKLVSIRQLVVLAMLAVAALGTFIAVKAGAPALIYDHFVLYMLFNLAVSGIVLVIGEQTYKRMGTWPGWCQAVSGVASVLVMFTIVSLGASIVFAPQLFASGFTLYDAVLAYWSGSSIVSFVRTACRFILR